VYLLIRRSWQPSTSLLSKKDLLDGKYILLQQGKKKVLPYHSKVKKICEKEFGSLKKTAVSI